MIPSWVITMARNQTNTTTDIIPDAEAYTYLNIVVDDFWDWICDNTPWYSNKSWTYDITGWTAAYVLPVSSANTTLLTSTFWIGQIIKAGIKYDSDDTYYTPLSLEFLEQFRMLPDFYVLDTGEYPRATIDSTSLTIAPTPTSSVTNWLQIRGTQTHFPLSTSTEDVEWVFLIPAQWHYILVFGMKMWFYGRRGIEFEWLRQQAEMTYQQKKLEAMNQARNRKQQAPEWFEADLSYYS